MRTGPIQTTYGQHRTRAPRHEGECTRKSPPCETTRLSSKTTLANTFVTYEAQRGHASAFRHPFVNFVGRVCCEKGPVWVFWKRSRHAGHGELLGVSENQFTALFSAPLIRMDAHDDRSSLIAPGLYGLLMHLVDYAGLFPPARLALDDAMHNYRRYREGPNAWMLARFVIPVTRLSDLTPYRSFFRNDSTYHFSTLGTGGDTRDAFLAALDDDLHAIDAFEEQYDGRAYADVMEVPLPQPLVTTDVSDGVDFLGDVHRHLVRAGTAQMGLFLEVPLDDTGRDALPALAAACAEHNSRQSVPARCPVGLKMRCGGLDPDDVPSVAAVADFLATCVNTRVRFKATAGLHHPVRHYNDELGGPMHGFLNLFVAAVMAYEHELTAEALRPILREEDPDAFRCTKTTTAWRDLKTSLDTVHHVRDTLALSIGSCSFEEPVDDLRDLGLL